MRLMREPTGQFWLVSQDGYQLAWSPTWRSEVPPGYRHTHLGVVGQAQVLGWSAAPLKAVFLLGATVLGPCSGSVDDVEAMVIAAGGRPRLLGSEAPLPLASDAARVMIFADHSLMRIRPPEAAP